MFKFCIAIFKITVTVMVIIQSLAIVPTQAMSNPKASVIGHGGPVTSSSVSSEGSSSSQSSSEPFVPNSWPNYKTLNIDKTALKPLSPNLNHDAGADRINIIFYSTDKNIDYNFLKQSAINSLAINRDFIFDDLDPKNALGVFSIEPYKSNIERFNFWIYESNVSPVNKENFNFYVSLDPTIFGLKFITPINVTIRPPSNPSNQFVGREHARLADVGYDENYQKINRYSNGNVELYYEDTQSLADGKLGGFTLAHELGHALFGLADEYSESDLNIPTYQYPNCAQTLEQASSWWNNELGKVDPFFYEYRTKYIQHQITKYPESLRQTTNGYEMFTYPEDFTQPGSWKAVTLNEIMNEESVRIKLTPGQCFSTSPDKVFRPNTSSIMGGENPIFGSVNRAVGEKILNLFSGNNTILEKDLGQYSFLRLNSFDMGAISPAKCQIKVTNNTNKVLSCNFENQNTNLDSQTKLKFYIDENSSQTNPVGSGVPIIQNMGDCPNKITNSNDIKHNYGGAAGLIVPLSAVDCQVSSDLKTINCQDFDITNLDDTKDYTIILLNQPTSGADYVSYFTQIAFGASGNAFSVFKFSNLVFINNSPSSSANGNSNSNNVTLKIQALNTSNSPASKSGLITVRTGDNSAVNDSTKVIQILLIGLFVISNIILTLRLKKRNKINLVE